MPTRLSKLGIMYKSVANRCNYFFLFMNRRVRRVVSFSLLGCYTRVSGRAPQPVSTYPLHGLQSLRVDVIEQRLVALVCDARQFRQYALHLAAGTCEPHAVPPHGHAQHSVCHARSVVLRQSAAE